MTPTEFTGELNGDEKRKKRKEKETDNDGRVEYHSRVKKGSLNRKMIVPYKDINCLHV